MGDALRDLITQASDDDDNGGQAPERVRQKVPKNPPAQDHAQHPGSRQAGGALNGNLTGVVPFAEDPARRRDAGARSATRCRCLRGLSSPRPGPPSGSRGSSYSGKLAAVAPAPEAPEGEETAESQATVAAKQAEALLQALAPKDEAPLLAPQVGSAIGRKTLILDLDETLVHSSFRPKAGAEIIISVELEGESHRVYVLKRPGVDRFLIAAAQLYEVVVFTASVAKYANPLLDELDKHNTVSHRLFREACTRCPEGYIKDLSRLGRDLKKTIIVDNSPICYTLQKTNAIPIRTWRNDVNDRELDELTPILKSLLEVEDIPMVLGRLVWTADEDEANSPTGDGAATSGA